MAAAGTPRTLNCKSGRWQPADASEVADSGRCEQAATEPGMSDEASPEEKPLPKRRGRPRKVVAKRHDPDEAPVDGNRSLDRIKGKEDGYRYFLASDEDVGEIQARGGDVCRRDTDTARPFFDDRRNTGEGEIKVKNLTLMKVREEDQVKHESFGLAEARRRRTAMKNAATNQIGAGQYASISNHEGGLTRQAI